MDKRTTFIYIQVEQGCPSLLVEQEPVSVARPEVQSLPPLPAKLEPFIWASTSYRQS